MVEMMNNTDFCEYINEHEESMLQFLEKTLHEHVLDFDVEAIGCKTLVFVSTKQGSNRLLVDKGGKVIRKTGSSSLALKRFYRECLNNCVKF